MPAKYSQKQFQSDGYYHIYNRGVEKRPIFRQEKDYFVLLSYIETYLLPKDTEALQQALADPDISGKERDRIMKKIQLNNFADTIDLLAFCLMPNHFHLLLHQRTIDGIDRFMNSLWTRYTMYVNKTYDRVGPLFQGVYKAVPIETDEQLLHLSRYIHTNPRDLLSAQHGLETYPYSSYTYYINGAPSPWIKPDTILAHFGKRYRTNYERFVVDRTQEADSLSHILHLIIADD